MRYLFILFTLFFFGFSYDNFAQSNALQLELDELDRLNRDFREKLNEAYNSGGTIDPDSVVRPIALSKGFFYPSVLRTLNISKDPVINEFSKTIDLLIIGRCVNMLPEGEQAFFQRMVSQLKADVYEVWIEMEGAVKVALLVSEEDELITSFVLMVFSEEYGGLIVLDYTGSMTPELLLELKNIDVDKLTKSLNNSIIKDFIGL